MTAPQSPSKKLERNLWRVSYHSLRSIGEGYGTDAYLVVNQLLKQRMASNSEQKAGGKHPQCYNNRSGKRLTQPTICITALKPNKRSEDNKWRW